MSDGALHSCPCPLHVGGQGTPFKVEVVLTTADEVVSLRQQLADAQVLIDDLRAQLNRAEYLFRCETVINGRLTDLCRAQRVQLPRSLFDRPY